MDRCEGNKRHSWGERGASMSFALFLFLICALLASIVLAATTAAAGRSVNMAERDKHYFNAVSAAEVLKSKVESEIVVVECTEDSLKIGESAGSLTDVASSSSVTTVSNGSLGSLTALSFLYLLGGNSTSGSTAVASVSTPKSSAGAGASEYSYESLWDGVSNYFDTGYYSAGSGASGSSSSARDLTDLYSNYVTATYTISGNTATTISDATAKAAVDSSLSAIGVMQTIYADGSFEMKVQSSTAKSNANNNSYAVVLRCASDVNVEDIREGSTVKKRITVQWKVADLSETVVS